MDFQSAMGPGGEDAWVGLGNECCEVITKEAPFSWEMKRILLWGVGGGRSYETKGVLEGVLGCLLYSYFYTPYFPVWDICLKGWAGSSRQEVDISPHSGELFLTAHFTAGDPRAGKGEICGRDRAGCKLLILCFCPPMSLPFVACVLLPGVVLEFPAGGERISFWMMFK